jgi:hypothetical protein
MKRVVVIACCLAVIGITYGAEQVAQSVRPGLLAIQVDSYGHPHLAYVQIGTGKWYVSHAMCDGIWKKEVVDSSSTSGGDNMPNVAMALDQNSEPGLAYGTSHSGGQLCYAHKSGTTWEVDDIAATAPSWPTLQYFHGAMPYVAYARGVTPDKRIFIGKPESGPAGWKWDSTDIDYPIDSQDKAFDFIFDQNDHPQFLYIYSMLNEHKLARWLAWSGSTWSGKEPVDSTGSKPNEYGVHMAKSPNNIVGAVYAHQESGTMEPYVLRYTSNNGEKWQESSDVDAALLKTVALGLNSGPVLAFDTLNRPHIIYLGGTSNAWELRHAWRQGLDWKKEVLATINLSYVWRIEFVIDRFNKFHIAYTAGNNAYDLYYVGPGGTAVGEDRVPFVGSTLSVSSLAAKGLVRFNLPGTDKALVNIYDVRGAEVATVTIVNGKGTWDTKGVPRGAYFARVSGNRKTVKFVIL